MHEHPDPAAYKGPEEGAPIGLDALAALPGPRLLKTHAQVRHLLGGRAAADSQQAPGLVLPPGPRYVIVSRNPFDACTSYYYHGERRAATRTSACGTIAVPNVVVSDRDRALSAALTVLSAAPLLALSLARSLTHSPPPRALARVRFQRGTRASRAGLSPPSRSTGCAVTRRCTTPAGSSGMASGGSSTSWRRHTRRRRRSRRRRFGCSTSR